MGQSYLKAIGHKSAFNVLEHLSFSSSFLIPGSYTTNVNGTVCKQMCYQGMCKVNLDNVSYILIGAYDKTE